jgi:hypothetical protein
MKGVILELQEPGRRPELDRATFLPGEIGRAHV